MQARNPDGRDGEVFDAVAEAYDRERPGYRAELVDTALRDRRSRRGLTRPRDRVRHRHDLTTPAAAELFRDVRLHTYEVVRELTMGQLWALFETTST